MDRPPLTEKQEAVYKFLLKEMSGGIPPTVREIAAAAGIKSTSTVHAVLNALEEGGYISRNARNSRAIKIENTSESAMVPLVGRVTAGQPILAVENVDSYFPIPAEFMPNEESFMLRVERIEDYIPYPTKDAEGLFALKVTGLSMRDAGILDGDIVIADKNAPCRSGDIIIGMDEDSATVKRLLIKDGKVIFMPENPDFSPIIPEKPAVLGKVIGSFRKY